MPWIACLTESVNQCVLAVGFECNVEIDHGASGRPRLSQSAGMTFHLCFTATSSQRGTRGIARRRRSTVASTEGTESGGCVRLREASAEKVG